MGGFEKSLEILKQNGGDDHQSTLPVVFALVLRETDRDHMELLRQALNSLSIRMDLAEVANRLKRLQSTAEEQRHKALMETDAIMNAN
jgi:hypothetical protein